jgi:hypothetical protein
VTPPPIPSSSGPPPPLPSQSFLDDLAAIEVLAFTPTRRAEELAANLQEIYARAANAKFGSYDIRALQKAAPEIIYRLFDLRVGLRQRIADFEAKGVMSPDVVQGLRNVFRVLRYVSDMLGEIAIGNQRLPEGQLPARGFTGRTHNTLINPSFVFNGDVNFRSGDVILVRGLAHNSAAIARVGDVDSQFSHVGIVYVDDEGRHWLVESLIEDGAIISPLAAALDHGIARAVLYRHRDAGLAALAAERIYKYVARSHTSAGRRILYDFTMKLDDTQNLFCSKLVSLAYNKGSDGSYRLPSYPTQIRMKNRDFLERIGVATDSTFAPADIDIESMFDLVAEWQDYRATSDIRLQDFTMDKIFQWMEQDGMRFKETRAIKLISRLGKFSGTFSEAAKQTLSSVLPRVPSNMPRRTIATVAMLHRTAEPLYDELQELEHRSVTRSGVPMHGLEILDNLERIRQREGGVIGYLVAPQ